MTKHVMKWPNKNVIICQIISNLNLICSNSAWLIDPYASK